jgi:hypothetical protein
MYAPSFKQEKHYARRNQISNGYTDNPSKDRMRGASPICEAAANAKPCAEPREDPKF